MGRRGYVYALTNPDMPGLVKIGKSRDPDLRASELFTTGVPHPFVIASRAYVVDMDVAENGLHQKFSDQRVTGRREFFRVKLSDVLCAFEEIDDSIDNEKHSETAEKVNTDPTLYTEETHRIWKETQQKFHEWEKIKKKGPGAVLVYLDSQNKYFLEAYPSEAWKEFTIGYGNGERTLEAAFDTGTYENAMWVVKSLSPKTEDPNILAKIRNLCVVLAS